MYRWAASCWWRALVWAASCGWRAVVCSDLLMMPHDRQSAAECSGANSLRREAMATAGTTVPLELPACDACEPCTALLVLTCAHLRQHSRACRPEIAIGRSRTSTLQLPR